MIAPMSHLTGLPAETLEQIFLHLPGRDIIRVEVVRGQLRAMRFNFAYVAQVCLYLRGVVRDSPTLQHKRKLFTAGLIDNPSVSCDLSQRKKAYEEYVHKWSDAARVVKTVYELPPGTFSDLNRIKHPGGNFLLICRDFPDNGLAVVRVPSVVNPKAIEWWEVPPLPFLIVGFDAYPPDNVLAVAGEYGRQVSFTNQQLKN